MRLLARLFLKGADNRNSHVGRVNPWLAPNGRRFPRACAVAEE